MSIPNIIFRLGILNLFFDSLLAGAQTCSVTVLPLNFGQISATNTLATTATTTISISCKGFSPAGRIKLCFNFGTGTGGNSYAPRTAVSGSYKLNYNIYADPIYSTILGNRGAVYGPLSIDLIADMTGSTNFNQTIFGQVPKTQVSLPTGTYNSSFAGGQGELNYVQWLLMMPSCTTLTNNSTPLPLSISATIIKSCTLTATPINFGTISSLNTGTGVSASGSLTVTCTLNTPYSIMLDAGSIGPINNRAMQISSITNIVHYNLYRDINYSTIWGDGTSSTSIYSGVGTGTAQSIAVYGYVPNQKALLPGIYRDTITATITY